MQESADTRTQRIIRVGPDQVTITDTEVIIEARHEMPDWEVRDFDPPPIYFEDRKYYLVEKRRGTPPYPVRYVLLPWPEGQSASAKQFHTYDAEAVAERDAARRSSTRDQLVHGGLVPLYPFLGLLWSGTQKRLVRFGFIPRAITGISIFTVFCLLFVESLFTLVTINASLRSRQVAIGGMFSAFASSDRLQIGPVGIPLNVLDCLLMLACLADIPIRYTHYLRDDDWFGGFLEWLVPKSLRKL